MFTFIGKTVTRAWPVVIVTWLALLAASQYYAPSWSDVAQDKDFGFLPERAPTRVAEQEFQRAYPDEPLGSNIVIILENPHGGTAGTAAGKKFIEDTLEPELRKIAEEQGGLAAEPPAEEGSLFSDEPKPDTEKKPRSIIARIRTPNAPGTGALLESTDGKALLVGVELTTEFQSGQNWPTIDRIEALLKSLRAEGKIPAGTEVSLTGSAVLGRDHTVAELQSARSTEWLTVVLVVGLLILIYRAPLLALIPLATVFISVKLALNVLAILAAHGYVTLFQGIQIFITVLTYGAGVDYCLFLMARHKEEMDHGADAATAVSHTIGRVGAALAASAATVICGIGMMIFAEFGKFRQAGVAIPFCLFIALCATLTFSGALLRLTGRWAFWPYRPSATPARRVTAPLEGERRSWSSYFQFGEFTRMWDFVGRLLLRRPWTVLLTSVAVLVPFALVGVLYGGQLAYDLVGNLPREAPGVQGVKVLERHFPEGILGQVTVLMVNPNADFRTAAGQAEVEQITRSLSDRKEELGIYDVRSLSEPLGITVAAAHGMAEIDAPPAQREKAIHDQALERYTSDLGDGRKHIGTRLEIVLQGNPFTRTSVQDLDRLESTLRALLPGELKDGTQIYSLGTTASIRDLSNVRDSDHTRISFLVLGAVFVILVVLLRRPGVSFYMVLSVLFSYYATIGVTYLLFWALDPHGFAGLDWKVQTFLFTILIAVGEDYNIFLMARVHEEQERHGPFRGILCGMIRTGPIISSCGVIMAGTFASLMSGTLSEMQQLGFALAFGVLLDTFVVRPILVPSFLVILEKRRYRAAPHQPVPASAPETADSCHC